MFLTALNLIQKQAIRLAQGEPWANKLVSELPGQQLTTQQPNDKPAEPFPQQLLAKLSV